MEQSLDKPVNLCESQFPHLYNEDNNSIYLLSLLWNLNDRMHVQHLA